MPAKQKALFNLAVTLAFCLFFGVYHASGQNSNTMYFMDRVPQSSLLNPSHIPEARFHLGLPVISSLNTSVGSNFISYSDVIFRSSVNDSLITFIHPDADKNLFLRSLRNSNIIHNDLFISLLSFGVQNRLGYFSFSINERFSFENQLPKDLFVLLLKGNEDFLGKTADFSSLNLNLDFYREYALGFAYNMSGKLTVGAKAKLLFGKGNISMTGQEMGLYTDPDDYKMKLQSRFTLNTSLPVTVKYDEDGKVSEIGSRFEDEDLSALDWIFNNENKGLAFDLGATFKPIDALTLSASIIDLGFIRWKKDVYNFTMDGELDFEGFDISSAFNDEENEDVFENFLDSIADIFAISDTRNAYSKGLNTRIILGGQYQLNPRLRLGALSRTMMGNKHIKQALTLSANFDVGRVFSASVSYSMMNNSYNNLGAGLCLRGGPFQFFVVSDNVSAALIPDKIRTVNFWFGMNLVFGHKQKIQPEETTE